MYSPSLYGIALSIVKTEQDAGDVLQESFVKIWKNIKTFDEKKGTIFTWMLNITRNTAIDKYRKIKKIYTREKNEFIDSGINFKNTDFIGIKELIKQLRPEHVEVINELYFKGATQQEASESLNLPLGTVKSRARAAMKELRKVFKIITTLWFALFNGF